VEGRLAAVEQKIERLTHYAIASRWAMTDVIYDNTLSTRAIVCPLCQRVGTRDSYTLHVAECQFAGGRLERYQCPDCDLVFGPMKMLDLTEQQLAAEYRILYSDYHEANSTESETRSFQACQPTAGGLYLNWGCGAWSETIDQLRGEGWDVWGYEPAAPFRSPYVAASHAEISAKFDAVFSNNVLEHLRNPVAEFLVMRSYLKPGGVMTHSTPCYELAYENTRFHLYFYLGRSVELLAARTGMRITGRQNDGEYGSVTFQLLD
jgi:SAM-dependent methyltransferase